MSRREFQFVEGTSSKFWVIELSGVSHTVTFGRIGTAGTAQTKEFGSEAEARKSFDKLIAEKVKKGYKETGAAGGGSTASVAAAPASSPTKKVAKPAGKKAAKAKDADDAAAASAVATAPAAVSPAAAPPASAPKPIKLDQPRSIDLSPADWAVAVWRPRTPLKRPEPAPFDLAACAARLAKVPTGTYGWVWQFDKANIADSITREEAWFWLQAMAAVHKENSPAKTAEKLSKSMAKSPAVPDKEKVVATFSKAAQRGDEHLFLLLANLLSWDELIEVLTDDKGVDAGKSSALGWEIGTHAIVGFRRFMLPYATDKQLDKLRKTIRPKIDPKHWPTDHYNRPPMVFHLAAAAGMPDELLRIVQSWSPDFYRQSGWDHSYYHQAQYIVLGLGSPDLVQSEMRRVGLQLHKPNFIRGWLATTEYAALDYARDCIIKVTKREDCEELVEALSVVKAPDLAPHMLAIKLQSKAPKPASLWLEEHPGFAIAGLIDTANGRGQLADAAIDFLRDAKRKGQEAVIRKAVGDAPAERVRRDVLDFVEKVYPVLDAKSSPAWLKPAGGRAGKLPAWASPATLPPIVVDGSRLNDEQIGWVLAALRDSPAGQPTDLLKALRQHAEADSLDAFAWRLFELWSGEGTPSKEKWAMIAIGHLGGDASALRLTPLIRNWPGESQHARAVLGLECLRSINSDTALMCLNGIAQKLKFKGLKTKAMEYMDAIAAGRGMSRTELEDRIVPDLDLDERGTRIFDFGPRQFRFVLGPDLKPMVKDTDSKVKADLPAPGAKDDAEKAKAAVEGWKLLKKQIREVAKIQAERLEQSMVTGRRWTVKDFETLLVRHPLMTNFVRLLVWGGYDADGRLKTTFRVTEDQAYADQRDEETDLKGLDRVGVVHPLHLSQEQAQAWGEVLSDYEIVPPFTQIGRPVFRLESKETSAKEITRFTGPKVPATALVGTLERLAWVRGIPQDGGVFYEHSKPFPGANVTAVVQYDGVPVGYMEGWEDQQIERCFFVPGIYTPSMYPDHKNSVILGKVDGVAISEVLKDLSLIASKAK